MKHFILTITKAVLLSAVLFSFASVVNAQICVQPPPGLVSWWPGDGNADDIQGTNNGSVIGTVAFTTGKVGQAFNFGGAGHILIADSPSLNLINEFTLDFWYNRSSPGGFFSLFAKRGPGEVTNFAINVSDGGRFGLGLAYNDPTVIDPNSHDGNIFEVIRLNPAPPIGQFHHYAGTYKQIDSTHVELKMYIDGVLVRNEILLGNLANTLSTVDVVIGAGAPSGGERFRGLMDEVEIYNRALSAAEVLSIFNAGSEGKCKVTTVNIDIKPGSDPNCFNINGHGVIPVAILGSDTLNVLDIDTSTLFFAGLEVRVRGKKGPLCHGEDSNDDGLLDLVCQFEDDSTMWTPDSTSEATLAGMLFDGTEFEGTDSICVVP